MSEHISVTGEVEHGHSPQEIFAYCHRCKKENNKLTIEVNQGFMRFSVTARCPKCKRAIWTAGIEDPDEDMIYWHTKKDKKCKICKKPTNERDCVCYYFKGKKKSATYLCSEKCSKIDERTHLQPKKSEGKK